METPCSCRLGTHAAAQNVVHGLVLGSCHSSNCSLSPTSGTRWLGHLQPHQAAGQARSQARCRAGKAPCAKHRAGPQPQRSHHRPARASHPSWRSGWDPRGHQEAADVSPHTPAVSGLAADQLPGGRGGAVTPLMDTGTEPRGASGQQRRQQEGRSQPMHMRPPAELRPQGTTALASTTPHGQGCTWLGPWGCCGAAMGLQHPTLAGSGADPAKPTAAGSQAARRRGRKRLTQVEPCRRGAGRPRTPSPHGAAPRWEQMPTAPRPPQGRGAE